MHKLSFSYILATLAFVAPLLANAPHASMGQEKRILEVEILGSRQHNPDLFDRKAPEPSGKAKEQEPELGAFAAKEAAKTQALGEEASSTASSAVASETTSEPPLSEHAIFAKKPARTPFSVPRLAIGGLHAVGLYPQLGYTTSAKPERNYQISTHSQFVHQRLEAFDGPVLYQAEGWTYRQGLDAAFNYSWLSLKASTAFSEHNENLVLADRVSAASHLPVGSKFDGGVEDLRLSASIHGENPNYPSPGVSVSIPTGNEDHLLGTGRVAGSLHLNWAIQRWQVLTGWTQQSDLKTQLGDIKLKSNIFTQVAYSISHDPKGWSSSASLFLSQNPLRGSLSGQDTSSVLMQLGAGGSRTFKFGTLHPQMSLGFDGIGTSLSMGVEMAY